MIIKIWKFSDKCKFFISLISCFSFTQVEAQVSFTAVGDVLFDRGVKKTIDSNSVNYLFEDVKSIISTSDLAFFNLECPLVNKSDGYPLRKKYSFRADPANIGGLKYAGFNIASVANNHTIDYGKDAFLKTIDLLKSGNIFPVGGGANQTEAFKPVLIEKNGETFAFFGMVEFILEATVYNADNPYPAFGPIDTLCSRIKELNSRVDNIIVSFHWGKENMVTPTPHQIEFAHKVIDAGADLVLGHHPHVLQSIETYRDKLILYSLGNFVFDHHQKLNRQSVIFKCKFKDGKISEPQLTPVEIRNNRPILADSLKSLEIFQHLKSVSDGFNTSLIFANNSVLIDYKAEKTVKEITLTGLNFKIYETKIKAYNNFEGEYNYNLPDSDFTIKDACSYTEDGVIYTYTIVYNKKTDKSRIAIFPFSIDKSEFLQPSLDKHDHYYCWKIELLDVERDGIPEIILGVNKSTRYYENNENRIFVFNREKDYIYPKWLGSKLAFPFIDFKIDSQRKSLILLEETNNSDVHKIAVYKWNGFGFDREKALGEIGQNENKKIHFLISELNFITAD